MSRKSQGPCGVVGASCAQVAHVPVERSPKHAGRSALPGFRRAFTSPGQPRLRSDERGAIMLMCVPMIFLMIGLLYYMIGTGNQVILRERLQDAADAGALAGAVMYSRGMNIIALANIVMMGLVSLLIMLRLFSLLMGITSGIATGLAFFTGGASLAVVPPASAAGATAEEAFQALHPGIKLAINGLHYFEEAVKYGMPVAAHARVLDTVQSHYSPPAELGFIIPIPLKYPLPVENGNWEALCKKGAGFAAELILAPLDIIIFIDEVKDVLMGPMRKLAEGASASFCNPSGFSMPTKLPELELPNPADAKLPPSKALAICNSAFGADEMGIPTGSVAVSDSFENQYVDDFKKRVDGVIDQGDPTKTDILAQQKKQCLAAAQEEQRLKPASNGEPSDSCTYRYSDEPPPKGQKVPERPCDVAPCRSGDAVCAEYKSQAEGATEQCRPDHPPAKSNWTYAEREIKATVTLVPVEDDSGGYLLQVDNVADTDRADDPVLGKRNRLQENQATPPCGPGGTYSNDYNPAAGYQRGPYSVGQMLCTEPGFPDGEEALQQSAAGNPASKDAWVQRLKGQWVEAPGSNGLVYEVTWKGATYMISCSQEIKKISDLELEPKPSEPMTGGGSSSHCGGGEPVHMVMKQGSVLGSELFQIRAIAYGEARSHEAHGVVRNVPLRLRKQAEQLSGFGPDLSMMRSVFVAQAEYYFNTTHNPKGAEQLTVPSSDWLWDMNWRARLRRVRWPASDNDAAGSNGSSSTSGSNAQQAQQCQKSFGLDAPPTSLPKAGLLDEVMKWPANLFLH